jgi:hypothetical protein
LRQTESAKVLPKAKKLNSLPLGALSGTRRRPPGEIMFWRCGVIGSRVAGSNQNTRLNTRIHTYTCLYTHTCIYMQILTPRNRGLEVLHFQTWVCKSLLNKYAQKVHLQSWCILICTLLGVLNVCTKSGVIWQGMYTVSVWT